LIICISFVGEDILAMLHSMAGKTTTTESWRANHLNNAVRMVVYIALLLPAYVVYRYLLVDIITGRSHFLAYIVLWLFSAYVILPRIYRIVSKIYLPDYFFGRTQTSDGLLGDPINLAFNGSDQQLIAAMNSAGWHEAQRLTVQSSLKMVYTALRGVPYPNAPVSPLFVFGRKQSFAFEKEVGGNPRKRHHIRFWKTPEKWWLPGGYQADWLANASFDTNVSLSLFTGQVTHKIDANVDKERDFVIATLKQANVVGDETVIQHFTSSYHSRNGGGDLIHTDGALPFITISK
jgi:hypothetical protein